MADPKRRARDPQGVRLRLLESARQRFGSSGLSGTSLDLICRDAGVTKGAFFYHFTDKDDLIEHVIGAEADRLRTAVAGATLTGDAVDRVCGFVECLQQVALGPENHVSLLGLAAVEGSSSPRIRAMCTAAWGALTAELAELVETARRSERPTSTWDAERVAGLVIASYEGAWVLARASGDRGFVTTHLAVTRAWLRGLFGRGPFATAGPS